MCCRGDATQSRLVNASSEDISDSVADPVHESRDSLSGPTRKPASPEIAQLYENQNKYGTTRLLSWRDEYREERALM
jgi:hypothetical protein